MRRPRSPTPQPALRFLLDEGVPWSVGEALQGRGFDVIYHQDVLPPGAKDGIVARHAILNSAVLVAIDRDMKRLAGRFGKSDPRYAKLDLIKLQCPEPHAASRVKQGMSFIELEWAYRCEKAARRIFLEIGRHFLRTHR